MKKLGRSKDLQKKRDEAKKKMQSKTKEMDVLMKARMSDFKKKASDQTKKLKNLRGLFKIKKIHKPIKIEEVEPVSEIVKRFSFCYECIKEFFNVFFFSLKQRSEQDLLAS